MVMRTRAEAKAETREALIAAGMMVFGEQGLDASLDAICARAGYTRGAFYVHFPDRDHLIQAVMERVGAIFLQALFAGRPSLAATVARFVEAVATGAYPLTAKGGVRPHQLLQACARSPSVRAGYVALIGSCIEHLAQRVSEDQGKELRRDVLAGDVAVLMLAAVIGAQTMMELEVPFLPARLATVLLRLLRKPRRSRQMKRRRRP